jgi:hypothetical protein
MEGFTQHSIYKAILIEIKNTPDKSKLTGLSKEFYELAKAVENKSVPNIPWLRRVI